MARFDSGVRFDSGARFDEPDPAPNKINNMGQNLISQTMTDAQRDAMLTDLSSFDTKFTSFKCLLSSAQIARLSKLSAADIALLDMALTYAQQNPGAFGSDLNLPEFGKDIALAKQVAMVDAKAHQEADVTKCSLIAVLSDGFVAARMIYRVAQAVGRNPSNAAFLDAFGAHFAHGPQATPPPTPPTP